MKLLDDFEPDNETKDDDAGSGSVELEPEGASNEPDANSTSNEPGTPSCLRPESRALEWDLKPKCRVVFHFNEGKAMGTYVGPSRRKRDKGKKLYHDIFLPRSREGTLILGCTCLPYSQRPSCALLLLLAWRSSDLGS